MFVPAESLWESKIKLISYQQEEDPNFMNIQVSFNASYHSLGRSCWAKSYKWTTPKRNDIKPEQISTKINRLDIQGEKRNLIKLLKIWKKPSLRD